MCLSDNLQMQSLDNDPDARAQMERAASALEGAAGDLKTAAAVMSQVMSGHMGVGNIRP